MGVGQRDQRQAWRLYLCGAALGNRESLEKCDLIRRFGLPAQ
jgi:hypothetical protein